MSQILRENQWGVYLRAEPLEKVPMQDAPPMLKIKEIDEHNERMSKLYEKSKAVRFLNKVNIV